jgi:hypothetical protein
MPTIQLRAKSVQKKRFLVSFVMGAVAALCLAQAAFAQAQPPKSRRSQRVHMQEVQVTSPDGKIKFTILPDAERLAFTVTMGNTVVIEPSSIVMKVDGYDLSSGVVFNNVERYSIDETYPWYGAHSTAVNHCNGAKIDFFDHEAKELIDMCEALLQKAAEYHILVVFHGANKPTGRQRTWPNELVREAIRGMESSALKERARHETILPFTRLLAGPADYTAMLFNERRRDTTVAHQIASMAVFAAPLLTIAANPQTILNSPAVDGIKSVPTCMGRNHRFAGLGGWRACGLYAAQRRHLVPGRDVRSTGENDARAALVPR